MLVPSLTLPPNFSAADLGNKMVQLRNEQKFDTKLMVMLRAHSGVHMDPLLKKQDGRNIISLTFKQSS